MLIQCVKHLTGTPFLLHQSEENFVRLFFISVKQLEKLMETGSLYLGPLHSSFLNLLFLLTFSITMLIQCVKHLAGTPFLLHQSEENFVRLFFISVKQLEKLMETGSLYLGPLHSSFLNLLFWTIRMSPLTICPCFASVNGNVQLQGKLFILTKMSLVSNVFIYLSCPCLYLQSVTLLSFLVWF